MKEDTPLRTVGMKRTPKGDHLVIDAPDVIDLRIASIPDHVFLDYRYDEFPHVIETRVIFGTVDGFKAIYKVGSWSAKRQALKCVRIAP